MYLYQLHGNPIRTDRNGDHGIYLPGYRDRDDRSFQKRHFEPFAQEHAGSRTKFAGTGLGMSITKKLMEKWAERLPLKVSKKVQGTTFVLRIPFKTDPDEESVKNRRLQQKDLSKVSEDSSGRR